MPPSDSTHHRATRGAQLLDQRLPDWNRHIRVGRIDTTSVCDCVLGQLAASDVRVLEYLRTIMHPTLAEASKDSWHGTAMLLCGTWPTREWMHHLGFSGEVWAQLGSTQVNLLDAAWAQLVTERGGARPGRRAGSSRRPLDATVDA